MLKRRRREKYKWIIIERDRSKTPYPILVSCHNAVKTLVVEMLLALEPEKKPEYIV